MAHGYCDIQWAKEHAINSSCITTRDQLAKVVREFKEEFGINGATLYAYSYEVQKANGLKKQN